MLRKYIFTPSQQLIVMTSLLIVFFFNKTFFVKLMTLALVEHNYIVLVSAPFVLTLIVVAILNILLLLTHRHSFKGVLMLVLMISAASSYFIDSFGTIIDKEMLTNIIQTDRAEVFDLMTPKLFVYLGIGAIFPMFFIVRYRLCTTNYMLEVGQKGLITLFILSIIGALYVFLCNTYNPFFRSHKELRMYLNPIYPIASFVKFVQLQSRNKKVFTPIALDATMSQSATKKLVILIVGETARAENFSLNGYSVPTNPLLQSRHDIVNFSNFYSCGTATAVSVPCIFSKYSREEYSDEKNSYENLIDITQKVGVRVIWRDNNSGRSKGVADRVENAKYYDGKIFDEVLFEGLQNSIDEKYEDTLIVLHQEGSHGPTYFKRYPDQFKKFIPACDTQDLNQCTQQQIINTYNNTILYTDYIVNQAIGVLEKNEHWYSTTLMYVSDHGESLGENGVYFHGIPYFMAPDAQKHIPAVFYFGQNNQNKFAELKSKKAEYFSHDNIFHTVLGIFNIKTSEYKMKLDMLAL